MSQKDIEKNLKLSSEFNTYVMKNPAVVKNLNSSTCIVMGSPKDPELTQKNRELAKKITKEEHRKCYQAIRVNGSWEIKPVAS